MKKNLFVAGLVGIIIGCIIALVSAPLWAGMFGYRNTMMGKYRTDGQYRDTIDAHFIEQMIPHHEDAILMADLALEKSKRPEIRQLAQDIQRTQSAEIEQMRLWYQDWFNKTVPDIFSGTSHGMGSGMMHGGMMGDAADINSLAAAADFDKKFIEQMIPHHQMAVMMGQMLGGSTSRTEMKQLAKNIIEAQTREINLMRDWYRQWYENDSY